MLKDLRKLLKTSFLPVDNSIPTSYPRGKVPIVYKEDGYVVIEPQFIDGFYYVGVYDGYDKETYIDVIDGGHWLAVLTPAKYKELFTFLKHPLPINYAGGRYEFK